MHRTVKAASRREAERRSAVNLLCVEFGWTTGQVLPIPANLDVQNCQERH
ncbi:hypothetical protein NKH93_20200 [Mesorhizobium sp. M0954]